MGVITAVLTLLGWSSIPLFLRHFSESIDPWTSNGWRYGFSALVWAPVLIAGAWTGRLPRGLWRAAVVPSLVNALGQAMFTAAHYCIDPGLVTFGLRSQLVFVAIGAWLLFPVERRIIRTRSYLAGLALLVAGTGAVMLSGRDESTAVQAAHGLGVALAVGSGLLFAAYGLAVRRYMARINSVVAFAAICQYTALALVAMMLVLGDRAGLTALDLGAGPFMLLLLSALIGIAIGHVFYYVSIARLGVAVTAGVLQLQPFVVSIASLSLFGERLSWAQWLGGCAAVGGAILMLAVQRRVSQRQHITQAPLQIAEGESGA